MTTDFGRTKTKTIKLKNELLDTLIQYETSNATLVFSIKDSKRLLEKELTKKQTYQIRDNEGTKALLDYLNSCDYKSLRFHNPYSGLVKIDKDIILSGVFYNWLARDLLLDKKAHVILKSNNSRLRKIKFEIYYDRLGNYRETFILPNDSVLIEGKILFGE